MVAKVNAASVPRSERILGRATCLATDAVGDFVRIRAAKVGNLFQVEKVDISTPGSPPAAGVVAKKLAATDCIVQFHGPVKAVYSGLTPGASYLVGTDAQPATVGDGNYPVAGSDFFQPIGIATSSDELLLLPYPEAVFGAPPGGSVRLYTQALSGLINGSNQAYTTALNFVHDSLTPEKVFYNGIEMEEGAGNDYVASESGGVGTGYDTITMTFAPIAGDKLWIDFTPAP